MCEVDLLPKVFEVRMFRKMSGPRTQPVMESLKNYTLMIF